MSDELVVGDAVRTVRLLMAVTLGLGTLVAPSPASAEPSCFDRAAPITYEEERIDTPGTRIPYDLVTAGGFDPLVARFADELCRAGSVAEARQVVAARGADLWRAAVERAQGIRTTGTIDRYDDRPLYWARLLGTRDLRRWQPAFALTAADRTSLTTVFGYASRGVSSTDFPSADIPGTQVTRVLVSGFDPYQLNGEIRRSNPSGAAALQLDGRRFTVGDRVVQVETVALPVTWSGFDAGVVEDAFGPHLIEGAPERADLIMTISQGHRGVMAIEQWAGAWRGGFADNNDEGEAEPVPPAPDPWAGPVPQPEFIATTLPVDAMIDAGTGPWTTYLNTQGCGRPAGDRPSGQVHCWFDEGPTPGMQARSGGGGDYLSNESMYRANRLRLALGATDVAGGHLHISALNYPGDRTVVIDAAFTADRTATVDQTAALVRAAGAAVTRR
jgi:pyrrolidone-carboxylate peptidase